MAETDAIRIGLLGCGTVGTGVLRILKEHVSDIEARLGVSIDVVRIAVANKDKERDPVVPTECLTEDPMEIVNDPAIQLVVEVIGGYEPARTLLLEALRQGKHVVTANKALLARHGTELFRAADHAQRDVIFEASVGGGIPIIRTLREGLASERIESIHAIINGTCNYILSAMLTDGTPYEQALDAAQRLGYAEADPTMDVGGIDAAQKLSILISLAYGSQISFDDIPTEGIDDLALIDMEYARDFGYVIKPLAIARAHPNGIEARVQPTLLPRNNMLATVAGVFNAVRVESQALGPILVYGQGAGMLPTAASVVSDVIELGRNIRRGISGRLPHLAFHEGLMPTRALRDSRETTCPFYLRFSVADEPGVLATIAGTLSASGVSISRMVQKEVVDEQGVHVVMLTHQCPEGSILDALDIISALPFITESTRFLRIEQLT
jgi:homoserine dehydrogenase